MYLLKKLRKLHKLSANNDKKNTINRFNRNIHMRQERINIKKEEIKSNNIIKQYKND